MLVKYIAIAVFICICSTGNGQLIRPLSVGDTVQTEKPFSLMNANDSLLLFSKITEDLLLLDFWGTWCSTCIAKFPQLDSLQQAFEGKIKIVLVNWDEQPAAIQTFLSKYTRKKKQLTLPVIAGDTVLRNLFPHYSLPHYVWIYKGRLLATTGPGMVSEQHILKILAGEPVSFKMKRDVMNFDSRKLLLEDNNGGTIDRQLYRSLFTLELEGLAGGYSHHSDSATQRWSFINFSIANLYQVLLGFEFNRMILEVRDTTKYTTLTPDLFSYELTAPIGLPKKKATAIMQADLNRYLGLTGRVEKRRVDCYVLKRGKSISPVSKTSKIEAWENEDRSVLYLRNFPFETFVRELNYSTFSWPSKPIFIDETGYSGNISFALPYEARTNMKMLSKLLKEKGFLLKKESRVLEVFVLRE